MNTFKRRQYIAVGKVIRNCVKLNKNTRQAIVCDLVKMFKFDNPNFDEATFRALCNAEIEDDKRTRNSWNNRQNSKTNPNVDADELLIKTEEQHDL